MTSIYDIAYDAGVSVTTVSRALNHPELVSERTRDRILSVAERLGYPQLDAPDPHPIAVTTVVRAIGPFSRSWAAQQHLQGILAHARAAPVEVIVHDHAKSRFGAHAANRHLAGDGADGILLAALPATPGAVRSLSEGGVPVVLTGESHPDLPSVSSDHRAGARVVAEFLSGLPSASVVLVRAGADTDADAASGLDPPEMHGGRAAAVRFTTVARELRARGLPVRSDAIVSATPSRKETTALIAAAMAGRRMPITVFAVTDDLAAAVLRAAAHAGLTVPGDVQVIGYGDTPVAEALGVTSVRDPLHDEGRLALELLIALARGQRVPARSHLRPVVIRRSTTLPVGRDRAR